MIFARSGWTVLALCGRSVPLLVVCSVLASAAQAAIVCNNTPSNVTLYYDSGSAAAVSATGTIDISCTRLSTDPTQRWFQFGAALSANASGAQRRVKATTFLNYSLFINANNTGAWTDGSRNARTVPVQVNFGSSLSGSAQAFFYVRMPAAQIGAKATYTDTFTVTPYDNSASTGSFSVFGTAFPLTLTAVIPETCVVSSPPGNINLVYTSFQTTAATSTTSVAVRCTPNTNFSLALDTPVSSTILGLNYSLSLSFSGGLATGVPQNSTITATIPAGQAGTCSVSGGPCVGAQTRTLTLTY